MCSKFSTRQVSYQPYSGATQESPISLRSLMQHAYKVVSVCTRDKNKITKVMKKKNKQDSYL